VAAQVKKLVAEGFDSKDALLEASRPSAAAIPAFQTCSSLSTAAVTTSAAAS